MPETYLPTREADLDDWARAFDQFITATPVVVGLSAAQATAFNTLFTTWHAAYLLTKVNTTRTPSSIQAKNDAKVAMIDGASGIRQLVNIIQAFPGTTNEQRVDLSITVPDVEPTPIPAPTVAPGISIVSAVGRTVKMRLFDPLAPKSKAKPEGVKGASVYSFVGDSAPNDIESWKYEGSTCKTTFDVEFPSTIANGATVWFTAYWTNPKLESGPPCQPVSTNIPGGLSMAA